MNLNMPFSICKRNDMKNYDFVELWTKSTYYRSFDVCFPHILFQIYNLNTLGSQLMKKKRDDFSLTLILMQMIVNSRVNRYENK